MSRIQHRWADDEEEMEHSWYSGTVLRRLPCARRSLPLQYVYQVRYDGEDTDVEVELGEDWLVGDLNIIDEDDSD